VEIGRWPKAVDSVVRPRGFEPLTYESVVRGSTHNFNNFKR